VSPLFLAVTVVACASSAAFTSLVVRTGGLSKDVPNARSSHATVTPRGGGVSFVLTVIAGAGALIVSGLGEGLFEARAAGMVLLAATSAGIGLVDDFVSLSSRSRLLIEMTLASLFVACGMRWTALDLGVAEWALPPLVGEVLAVLWIVWLTNLVNFMDGINGLVTTTSAICAGLFAVVAAMGGQPLTAAVMALLAGALAGFLPFNFPRARIFMGDGGSLFIGTLLAGAAITLSEGPARFPWLLAITVLAPLIFDATITLGFRAMRREKLSEAHRSHTYQVLASRVRSHTLVTVIYAAVTAVGAGVAYGVHAGTLVGVAALIHVAVVVAAITIGQLLPKA